jgi:hypothetical protein
MYLNARHTQRVEILAFMAGREQKPVARTDVTVIEYDTFVEECKRASRALNALAPNALTLTHYNGRDRKLTLSGTVEGETVTVEVVLDATSIEVSTTLKPVLVGKIGRDNMDSVNHFLVDPSGPTDHVIMWRTRRLACCNIDAYRVGGRAPYLVIRAENVMHLRRIFEWLFGVRIDYEIPPSRKRYRDALDA